MKRLFVIEGNSRDSSRILEKIKSGLKTYELFTFEEKSTKEQIAQSITEFSCFDENRLFIIKKLPATPKKGTLSERRKVVLNHVKKFFKSIPKGNVVVFYNIGITDKTFLKKVKEIGNVYTYDKVVKIADARKKIMKFFDGKQKEIGYDDAIMIAESLASTSYEVNVDELDLLLEKIAQYMGGAKKITRAEINAVCAQDRSFIIWNLFKMFDEKNFCSAFGLIYDYLFNLRDPREEIFSIINNNLVWRYSLLLMAKDAQKQKMKQDEIGTEISKISKLKREKKAQLIEMNSVSEGKPLPPEYSLKMIGSVCAGQHGYKPATNYYSLKQLVLIHYALSKAALRIRRGCTVAQSFLVLQFVFMVICDMIKKETTLSVLENDYDTVLKIHV